MTTTYVGFLQANSLGGLERVDEELVYFRFRLFPFTAVQRQILKVNFNNNFKAGNYSKLGENGPFGD